MLWLLVVVPVFRVHDIVFIACLRIKSYVAFQSHVDIIYWVCYACTSLEVPASHVTYRVRYTCAYSHA